MSIDEALLRIDELLRQLDAIPGDDFAARYEIQKLIDEIRADLPRFDKDAGRSREDLEAELEERRRQLEALLHDVASLSTQMGAGKRGAGDATTVRLRQQALEGGGIDDIKRRIGELESALNELD